MSNDIIQLADYTLKCTLKYDRVVFPCPLCKKVADDNIWATFKILKVQFEYDPTSSVITSVLTDLTQVGSCKPDARCEASFESTLDY